MNISSLLNSLLFSSGGDASPEVVWSANDIKDLLNQELSLSNSIDLEESLSNLSSFLDQFSSLHSFSISLFSAVIDNYDGSYSTVYFLSENELLRAYSSSVVSEISIVPTIINSSIHKKAIFHRIEEELTDIFIDFNFLKDSFFISFISDSIIISFNNSNPDFNLELSEYISRNSQFSFVLKSL